MPKKKKGKKKGAAEDGAPPKRSMAEKVEEMYARGMSPEEVSTALEAELASEEAAFAAMTPEQQRAADEAVWQRREAAMNDKSTEKWIAEVSSLTFLMPTTTDRRVVDQQVLARPPRATPEIWSVSFTNAGGQWMVTIIIEHIGTPHDGMVVRGAIGTFRTSPDARDMIHSLFSAMAEPEMPTQTGPPHRPLQLFLAYRLKGSFDEIRDAMGQCQIACVLEEKEAAKASAAEHGTEYKGRNLRQCASCGSTDYAALKKCSACGEVMYCSKECQKQHWKVHKPSCKKSAKSKDSKSKNAGSNASGAGGGGGPKPKS
mmetsp:Transcript_65938/g.182255  ORF Transcript_65938/g.182255 Transcript_65938/m.182255 type:complete len:315 (-) Transcript_65938:59-1003(-)